MQDTFLNIGYLPICPQPNGYPAYPLLLTCLMAICPLVISLKYFVGIMMIAKTLSPEIEIRVKVYMCSRCGHLWERRRKGAKALPITCPNCNSPYWNTRGKSEKKLPPLRFHGEEVLDSNFDEVFGKESHKK